MSKGLNLEGMPKNNCTEVINGFGRPCILLGHGPKWIKWGAKISKAYQNKAAHWNWGHVNKLS